jgi:hypothetical protein
MVFKIPNSERIMSLLKSIMDIMVGDYIRDLVVCEKMVKIDSH